MSAKMLRLGDMMMGVCEMFVFVVFVCLFPWLVVVDVLYCVVNLLMRITIGEKTMLYMLLERIVSSKLQTWAGWFLMERPVIWIS